MAKIVTVNLGVPMRFEPTFMFLIRWLKISEALARAGHQVDIATDEPEMWRKQLPIPMGKNLRRVPLSKVKWENYDVVKTLFHTGFETLEKLGGLGHPYIISKLGSVVDRKDRSGIYFYGKRRKSLFSTQEKIHRFSRYVTVLTPESKSLWISNFGRGGNVLLVPGAADRRIPGPKRNLYPRDAKMRCLFSGNIYNKICQPEAHEVLTQKLNRLAKLLTRRNIRLYMMGPGDSKRLDPRYVTYLGEIPYQRSWDYLHFAQVGIVLALGKYPNHNESTKIYHYLRVGLPVVCESGFSNQNIIKETESGSVVENGNMALMAEKIAEVAHKRWSKWPAIRTIMEYHTWDHRAQIYDRLIKADLG